MNTNVRMRKKLHQPDKISYKCKDNIFFLYIYVNFQTKTVSSMITKDTSIRVKVAKICDNMFMLNQNWSLNL